MTEIRVRSGGEGHDHRPPARAQDHEVTVGHQDRPRGDLPVDGVHLLAIAEEPVPGWARSRLCPPCSPDLGRRRPDPSLLVGAPTSTPSTGLLQRRRLVRAGLRGDDLPVLVDADTTADTTVDTTTVAALAASSRFTRALDSLAVLR